MLPVNPYRTSDPKLAKFRATTKKGAAKHSKEKNEKIMKFSMNPYSCYEDVVLISANIIKVSP